MEDIEWAESQKDTIASKYQLEFKNHYDLDSFCTAVSPEELI